LNIFMRGPLASSTDPREKEQEGRRKPSMT